MVEFYGFKFGTESLESSTITAIYHHHQKVFIQNGVCGSFPYIASQALKKTYIDKIKTKTLGVFFISYANFRLG